MGMANDPKIIKNKTTENTECNFCHCEALQQSRGATGGIGMPLAKKHSLKKALWSIQRAIGIVTHSFGMLTMTNQDLNCIGVMHDFFESPKDNRKSPFPRFIMGFEMKSGTLFR